ncbi:MAG: PKD domain-containing protein [Planctomycetota bacterium]
MSPRFRYVIIILLGALWMPAISESADGSSSFKPTIRRVEQVSLALGESVVFTTRTGDKKVIRLIAIDEKRDPIRDGIRSAEATVRVGEETRVIPVGGYFLPTVVNGMKLDVTVTRGYLRHNLKADQWRLSDGKDAILRFWDADAPLLEPGTFVYPVRQRFPSPMTQIGNEIVHVNGAEFLPPESPIYYHCCVDIGGYDGKDDVVATVGGQVCVIESLVHPLLKEKGVTGQDGTLAIFGDDGWIYFYIHLADIKKDVALGSRIEMGEPIGHIGKRGYSGGWSHLHLSVYTMKGEWVNAYPFLVEAACREQNISLLAVARPHRFARVGESVAFDGTASFSSSREITGYRWTYSDGTVATGSRATKTYKTPGFYSEILEVEDSDGNKATDVCPVYIVETGADRRITARPATLHAAYHPSLDIRPGTTIDFTLRTVDPGANGRDVWDFGDGQTQETQPSDAYVSLNHSYSAAGVFKVTIQHVSDSGFPSSTVLFVVVNAPDSH